MTTIDARGLRCPWPAIRLAKLLRDPAVAEVEIVADDPAAQRELAAVAAAGGARFVVVAGDRFRIAR